MPERLARARALTLRLVLATVVAAVLVLPLAGAWAVTRAEVHEKVGITPTTLRVTTAGHSEVRLGVAGRVVVPRAVGPFGVVAQVDGPGQPPGSGGRSGDLAAYVSPQMLDLYTALFHDPAAAVEEYVDLLLADVVRRFVLAEIVLSLVGGAGAVLVLDLLGPGSRRPHRARRAATAAVAALATTATLAVVVAWPEPGTAGGTLFDLPALDGSAVAGSTTDSPVVRLLLGDAVPKIRTLVQRQEDGVTSYRENASAALTAESDRMTGPREGETAVLMQSDMHCNTTMIALQRQVVTMLGDRFGADVPAGLAVTGDLTTNGTAAEGSCIRSEAAIADGRPIAAVTGNHESATSAAQMADAGMTVLDGSRTDLAGLDVLGDADPERTELFGGSSLRGDLTEADVGEALRASADEDRPAMVLVHEAYAAAAFLGVTDMRSFLDDRGDPTVRTEDDVPDIPAGAVFYGHWHRSVEPRVVWDDDGTWTLVMELDTSGGAIDTPTLNHFSTPWSRPQQEASFPVVFWDADAGLVTGYQLYRFETDGTVTVEPRVDVGDP